MTPPAVLPTLLASGPLPKLFPLPGMPCLSLCLENTCLCVSPHLALAFSWKPSLNPLPPTPGWVESPSSAFLQHLGLLLAQHLPYHWALSVRTSVPQPGP